MLGPCHHAQHPHDTHTCCCHLTQAKGRALLNLRCSDIEGGLLGRQLIVLVSNKGFGGPPGELPALHAFVVRIAGCGCQVVVATPAAVGAASAHALRSMRWLTARGAAQPGPQPRSYRPPHCPACPALH